MKYKHDVNTNTEEKTLAVQKEMFLESFEKTVVLVGECSNTVTCKRQKNNLLSVTGTCTLVGVMFKEKASFKSSLPSPTLINMEVLTHVHPLLKNLFFKKAKQTCPLA